MTRLADRDHDAGQGLDCGAGNPDAGPYRTVAPLIAVISEQFQRAALASIMPAAGANGEAAIGAMPEGSA